MTRKNPFDGDSYYPMFARVTYKRFMNREWVTQADVMAEFLGRNSAAELPCSISKCDHKGELKKAFVDIKEEIIKRLGCDCFKEKDDKYDKRKKRYLYVGENDDPLADLRNAKVISDLKQYWQFCQDSAGFFPISWLDYFFKDSRDLLEIKDKQKKGEQVLAAIEDRNLTNIELLPFLYEAIKKKQVLAICYNSYRPYSEGELSLIVSPHYLKEFNGRWYLFGNATKDGIEWKNHIALDRIVGRPKEIYSGAVYVDAPAHYYEDYFKNIVGVTHKDNERIEEVRVRAHTYYMFKLSETKRLHASQRVVVPWGEHTEGKYGEFSVQVEVNDEFVGRILQMGDGLEVVSPKNVRDLFQKRVEALANLYKKPPFSLK